MTDLFQSRPDGEYRQCPSCEERGYGVDSWLPLTTEYWAILHGRLQLSKCKACRSEVRERKHGFVPAREAA